MYSLEISLRYSPFPVSIQKKEYEAIKKIYEEIKVSMKGSNHESPLIEIECEKLQDKKIAVLAKEVISVQIYEKSTGASGTKRPGFSLDT